MDTASQHTHGDAFRFHTVAIAHVSVTDVDFANQFADEVVHIIAVGAIGQQFSVFLLHRWPVHTMHVGCIEEVAHLAPSFIVDLRPFGAQFDPFLHVAEVDGIIALATFTRFAATRHGTLRCVNYLIATAFTHEHLAAIG